MSAKAIIYALSDPRNPSIPKYIGRTTNNLRKRLRHHLMSATTRPKYDVCKWINSIRDLGLVPTIYAVEACDTDTMAEREMRWIRFFRPLGCLTNMNDGGSGERPIRTKCKTYRFSSIRDACDALGVCSCSMYQSLHEGIKCCGQFWEFDDDFSPISNPPLDPIKALKGNKIRKLSEVEKDAIVSLSTSISQSKLAQRFGVTPSNISRLLSLRSKRFKNEHDTLRP